jgi:flavorubredoxin
LYRLGATVPTDPKVSWVPDGVSESLPLNVFVLTTPQVVLVVDTGPLALYPALGLHIRELVGEREIRVLVTRNDPEAMGGVGTLLPQFDPSVLYYFGGGSILEWVWDDRDGPGASGDLFGTVPVESPAEIVLGPGRRLRILRPPLAVLNTVWVYDEGTRTLFTSDGFSYLPPEDGKDGSTTWGGPLFSSGVVDPERALAFLRARFDWVERINSSRLVDELQALLAPLEIENLAPSHGRVLHGAQTVQAYLAAVEGVLGVPRPGAAQGGALAALGGESAGAAGRRG